MGPSTISEVWPLIQGRVFENLERVPGGAKALIDQCLDGRATVWRGKDAVFVLSLAPNPDGGVDLFVRLAVSLRADADVVGTHEPFLQKVATDLGASWIRFRSSRRGFERALGSHWAVAHVEYATKVEPCNPIPAL